MNIYFLQVFFKLKFYSPVFADTNPLFVLRSMLGKNLRSMCCISHKSVCAGCQFSKTCVYAFLFETILSSENSTLPGRNRASHPFSFSDFKNFNTSAELGNPEKSSSRKNSNNQKLLDEFSFRLTLFGRAIEYLPYIYATFVRAGRDGLFKSRVPFKVESVLADGKNILIDENHLDMNISPEKWKLELKNFSNEEKQDVSCEKIDVSLRKTEILVELKSPLRFKVNGKYTVDFSAQDFMNCLFRRAKTLCSLYGEISSEERNLWSLPAKNLEITEKNLRWLDLRHYSARQKTVMDLGGAVGIFKLRGKFSDAEKSLLKFAEIAGAGKNTNFGLGQLEYCEK